MRRCLALWMVVWPTLLVNLLVAGWVWKLAPSSRSSVRRCNRLLQTRMRQSIKMSPRLASLASETVPDSSSSSSSSSLPLSSTTTTTSTKVDDKADATTSNNDSSAFDVLLDNIASCLAASDLKGDRGTDGAATGWTAWVDERSAYRLQSCLNALRIADEQDVALLWSRWFQAAPHPFVVDLSAQVRSILNKTMATTLFESIGTTAQEFTSRIFVRLVVLPSGATLPGPMTAPTGAMVYGKLLYGGVTRFRLIRGSSNANANKNNSPPPRRAGERQLICQAGTASRGWLQYGGSPRNYEAVDMGPCLVMEVELLPKGPELAMMGCCSVDLPARFLNGVMAGVGGNVLDLDDLLEFVPPDEGKSSSKIFNKNNSDSDTWKDVCNLEDYFCTSTGGLRRQTDEIVRRVLDGRVVQPADESLSSVDIDRIRREEMRGLLELGLHPPKGLLLYGPPGCGKTQLAREISTILNARPPKIVAAPELLDRWVGGSEKLIRELFGDAENELRLCNGDATKSALHVIVIDECDAVFRKRTSLDGSSEATRASAVNQLLSKLDGVNALDNILLIGMTNRRELLDPALLRPGRLEVHVEIPLPDAAGRREILNIHFDALRKRGRLSQPLMQAIDGRQRQSKKTTTTSEQSGDLARWSIWRRLTQRNSVVDLASDTYTRGFSGADIAGLVRCAGSIALARTRKQDDGSLDSLLITLDDVLIAIEEVKGGRI